MKNGLNLISSAMAALDKHPLLLVPMLLCWAVYAPVIIAAKYYMPWDSYSILTSVAASFTLVLMLAAAYTWAAFMLLDLLRQIESGQQPDMATAFTHGSNKALRALPIVLVWSLLWYALSVIAALFRRGGGSKETGATPEGIARTLGGGENITLAGGIIHAVKKGVRMTVFMIYPALAWEDMGTMQAVRKGLSVAKSHLSELGTGFLLTEIAALLVFLPPGILFFLDDIPGVNFSDAVWSVTILYCAFAFSFVLFLEQMFTAELYLWHLVLEKATEEAERDGRAVPTLAMVKRPSVMDDMADLLLTKVSRV